MQRILKIAVYRFQKLYFQNMKWKTITTDMKMRTERMICARLLKMYISKNILLKVLFEWQLIFLEGNAVIFLTCRLLFEVIGAWASVTSLLVGMFHASRRDSITNRNVSGLIGKLGKCIRINAIKRQ